MTPVLRSKTVAWCGFLLVVALLLLTYSMRPVWWSYCDIFFLFMMAFSHAMAIMLCKVSEAAARKLDAVALVCGVLAIIAFFAEYFLFDAFLRL